MWRNKIHVTVHFVWTTWDRLPLIKPEFERELYRYIAMVCQDDHCEVLAVNGMADHVHLLVAMAPTICMADLMKHVKGGSSRFISDALATQSVFQWQGHYGAFSISPKDRSRVIAYVRNQKEHHADASLWPEAEEPTEEFNHDDSAADS